MISIVIPTHDRRAMVERAIESVSRQTFREWELIVVDDGSTDGTDRLVQGMTDSRVRLLRQPRSGVSAARNLGIESARFEWIALLDSDDCWMPGKLESQLDAVLRDPVYGVVHTEEIWIRRGRRVNPRKIHRKSGGWIFDRCLPLCAISPSSVMIHRRILNRVGMFDTGFPVCEDYDLWLRITSRYPVRFLQEPLIVKYGGHEDQLSRAFWGMDRFRVRALLKALESAGLTPLQRTWTRREIARKCRILEKGFRNRGKEEEAREYARLARLQSPGSPQSA